MGGEIKLAIAAMELASTILPVALPMAAAGAQALYKSLSDLHASGVTHLEPGQFSKLADEAGADMTAIFHGLSKAKDIMLMHVQSAEKLLPAAGLAHA